MTDNPVAAANARTIWKRETPPIAATSSRVSASARWLSINQSAFWAGFMNNGFRSKHAQCDRFARVSFDNPCAGEGFGEPDLASATAIFRFAENTNQGITGKGSLTSQFQSCILRPHSLRRLRKLPT